MSGRRDDWESTGEALGSGGQSDVVLVRSSQRQSQRAKDIDQIHSHNPWQSSMVGKGAALTGKFADAISDYARDDCVPELGAMKIFKLREAGVEGEQQALARLRQEIEVLQTGRAGLPKLLDFNVSERWMVTEYFPARNLEHNSAKYKGNVLLAFRAFLSLVKTVAALHADNIIHRDIKPANVFVREDDQLVLGDFGIVYLPDQPNRLTRTGESVGPHDYMPPWADVDGRLGEVRPAFDVYMLGKLLWCMVSGRLRLRREHFNRPEFDLTVLFAGDPAMHMVNVILAHCLVEEERDCKTSARELVALVSTYLQMLERGGQLLHVGVPRPCRVCGHGYYQTEFPSTHPPHIPKDRPVGLRLWIGGDTTTLSVFPYVCDTCGHVEFFTHGASRLGASGSTG